MPQLTGLLSFTAPLFFFLTLVQVTWEIKPPKSDAVKIAGQCIKLALTYTRKTNNTSWISGELMLSVSVELVLNPDISLTYEELCFLKEMA